jgi:antitoxin component of MazEF toxin-antitoxin module
MLTQIKKYGGSLVIVLPKGILKFYNLKVNDWVEISSLKKVKQEMQK